MKDAQDNILPTNTLDATTTKLYIVDPDAEPSDPIKFPPGMIWEYSEEPGSYEVVPSKYKITDDLATAEKDKQFLFTCPFLVMIYNNPDLVSYFLTTMEDYYSTDYAFIEDRSLNQFTASNISVTRNGILGDDYYTISIYVRPVNTDLKPADIVDIPIPYYKYDFTFLSGSEYVVGDILTYEQFTFTVTEVDLLGTIMKATASIGTGPNEIMLSNKNLEGGSGIGGRFSCTSYDIQSSLRAPKNGIVLSRQIAGDMIWKAIDEIPNEWSVYSGKEVAAGSKCYSTLTGYNTNCYIANTTFTADADEATDLSSGNWDMICGEWVADTNTYVKGDKVFLVDNDICIIYECATDDTTLTDSSKFNQYHNEDFFVYVNVKYDDGTLDTFVGSNAIIKHGPDNYSYYNGWKFALNPGDSFVVNDVLATQRVNDKGLLRGLYEIDGIFPQNLLYLPLMIDDYANIDGVDTFTLTGYMSVTDMVSSDSRVNTVFGLKTNEGEPENGFAIPIGNIRSTIHIFFNNPDANYTHAYEYYDYFKNYTLTNTFKTQEDVTMDIIKPIDYARSAVALSQISADDYVIDVTDLMLLRASWAKITDNINYFTTLFYQNYKLLETEVYLSLENNFSIDLTLYNTYGKSRFFYIGQKDTLSLLDNVTCTFRFGIKLNTISNTDTFLTNFKTFIKDEVESINTAGELGQYIYIMNLIADAKQNFSDITYMEYYGVNSFDETAQKIIGLNLTDVEYQAITNYVPEHININSILDNTVYVPDIDVLIIEDADLNQDEDN
jgi:hypothetical protein